MNLLEQSQFLKKSLKFILFGGKGGVGKTTCAAATALHLARTNPDKKILVFSADPAHSLSDSFGLVPVFKYGVLGDEVTAIKGFENLYGLEIDAKKLQEKFRQEHDVDIFDLATRAMYFDRDILLDFFSFSLPGMDELMAVMKIIDLLNAGEYDLVILDTAPTGHTIRLLGYVDQMLEQINVMEKSQEKYRYAEAGFKGRYVKDEADRFLDRLRGDIRNIKSILTDSNTTEFVVVAPPEAMGVYETERLLTALKKNKIPVNHIIVNGVNPEVECDFCNSKRENQEKYIKEMKEKFTEYELIKMPLFPHEVRGAENLSEFAHVLFGKAYEYTPRPIERLELRRAVISKMPELLGKELQFLFFGGKGGVGKTTCAAATALYLAKTNPYRKILIFSASPVHSLSDSFECRIGDKGAAILPNLFALEMDAKKLFEDFKKRYIEEINAVFDALEGERRVDLSFERRTTLDLFSLTPPGLDEIMALAKITEFTETREYDLFVLDTAPTGHLLRLLELPDIVMEWLDKLVKTLRKYDMMRIAETLKLLLETKKKIRDTQRTLTDPEKTEFVTVTIPEAMGIFETKRLLEELRSLRIPSEYIIINKVIPLSACSFCSSKRKEQEKYIEEISGLFAGNALTEMPMLPGEIRGIDALSNFAEIMYGG